MRISYKEFCDVFRSVVDSYRERLSKPVSYFVSGSSGTNLAGRVPNINGWITKYNVVVGPSITSRENNKTTFIPAHVGLEKTTYIMSLMEKWGYIENGFTLKNQTKAGEFVPYVKTICPDGLKDFEIYFSTNCPNHPKQLPEKLKLYSVVKSFFGNKFGYDHRCVNLNYSNPVNYKKSEWWFIRFLFRKWIICNILKSKWFLWGVSILAFIIGNFENVKSFFEWIF